MRACLNSGGTTPVNIELSMRVFSGLAMSLDKLCSKASGAGSSGHVEVISF